MLPIVLAMLVVIVPMLGIADDGTLYVSPVIVYVPIFVLPLYVSSVSVPLPLLVAFGI